MERPQIDESMHRRLCHFRGRVQGVGFRFTVKNLAMQYNVGGYVKNLPDGRVELVMEGPVEQMDRLVVDINRKMNGYIHEVDAMEYPATHEFNHFVIRH